MMLVLTFSYFRGDTVSCFFAGRERCLRVVDYISAVNDFFQQLE